MKVFILCCSRLKLSILKRQHYMLYAIKCDCSCSVVGRWFFLYLFHCALHNEAEKGLFIFLRSLCNCFLRFFFSTLTIRHTGPLLEMKCSPVTRVLHLSLQLRVEKGLLYESSSMMYNGFISILCTLHQRLPFNNKGLLMTITYCRSVSKITSVGGNVNICSVACDARSILPPSPFEYEVLE